MSAVAVVKILIVDDLEENLLALEALLRRDGLEVLKARSGAEALELLLVHDVALALLDVQMPEMDGFELAELMRGTERTRRVPIIFLTAGSGDSHRVFRGYEVGAVDFLFKPLDPVSLGHKVATFLDLHRQRLEIAEMLRLNEMFVAAVSHDLRSPLSTVTMGATVLDRQLTDPAAKRTLARIRTSTQRMTEMLGQLGDLARVRLGGGMDLHPAEVNFRVLADRLVEELRGAHPERGLIVEYDGGPTTGMWDELRLGQVVANLVGNALVHGNPQEDVRVRVSGSDSWLIFEVRNGGEIPAEALPQLFDPFRRGSARYGARAGLGLGLYIVQQIVKAHGGSIDVASSPQVGTTFVVRLPRHPGADAADGALAGPSLAG